MRVRLRVRVGLACHIHVHACTCTCQIPACMFMYAAYKYMYVMHATCMYMHMSTFHVNNTKLPSTQAFPTLTAIVNIRPSDHACKLDKMTKAGHLGFCDSAVQFKKLLPGHSRYKDKLPLG